MEGYIIFGIVAAGLIFYGFKKRANLGAALTTLHKGPPKSRQ